mmetsp:Transcript_28968/g.57657  ORF Transcript_28968/g.57657 Transcript_28968/m.57657 type:complete len:343 (-) Transcript_28968:876-1904(-)
MAKEAYGKTRVLVPLETLPEEGGGAVEQVHDAQAPQHRERQDHEGPRHVEYGVSRARTGILGLGAIAEELGTRPPQYEIKREHRPEQRQRVAPEPPGVEEVDDGPCARPPLLPGREVDRVRGRLEDHIKHMHGHRDGARGGEGGLAVACRRLGGVGGQHEERQGQDEPGGRTEMDHGIEQTVRDVGSGGRRVLRPAAAGATGAGATGRGLGEGRREQTGRVPGQLGSSVQRKVEVVPVVVAAAAPTAARGLLYPEAGVLCRHVMPEGAALAEVHVLLREALTGGLVVEHGAAVEHGLARKLDLRRQTAVQVRHPEGARALDDQLGLAVQADGLHGRVGAPPS